MAVVIWVVVNHSWFRRYDSKVVTEGIRMIAILTVTGLDHPGIVAAVSTKLAELDANILNISQTILDDYFSMICQCELGPETDIRVAQEELHKVGQAQGVDIRLQSEAIFRAMREV